MMSKTLWLLSASLFVGLWGQAYADDGSNFQSEALIVTASKRAQALDSLDGQAVVMRGDDIGLSRASSVDQLGGVVGDLTVRQRASRTYLSLTLRGQSSVDFYNPTVQIYLDGVPQDQATFGQALPLNLQQVEVLYGPQSTLYGRGAMGGVINLVSSPPDGQTFIAQGEVASRFRAGSALANLALGASTFLELSAGYRDEDGEYRSPVDGSRLGDSRAVNGRVRLRVAPEGGPVSALLTLSRMDVRSQEEQYVLASDLPTRTVYPADSHHRLTHDLASLRLDADLGRAKLTSVTAYQDRDYQRTVLSTYSPETQKTFTQELRLSDDAAASGALSYVAGLAFEHTDFTFARPQYGQSAAQTLKTYAAFGEATYKLSDRLDVTGGLRLDQHSVEATAGQGALILKSDKDFHSVSPKLAIGYQLREDTRLYAQASSGYKAGGFSRFVTPATVGFSYKPEKLWNLEAGLRARRLEDRLRFTAAAYFTRSDDYQYYVGFAPSQYLSNVGEVESKGAEARLDWDVDAAWRIETRVAYNKAKFTDYHNPTSPTANLTGNVLPYAPSWTGRAAVTRRVALPGALGRLEAQVGVSYSGRYWFEETNTLGQGAFALYDARLSWRPTDRWSLDLYGENLGDKLYAPYGVAFAPGVNVYQAGPSRQVGLRVRASY
ncbi:MULTISPECIES: TonB-dependent receptor [unclassified Caulobacter]|uniref:TonB-dependent receptor n=1 Tax=unclassified Caulobacter TaxID=2648921 RepID=UPI000782C8F8|nr:MULTISPECIES: TonB-dependent receptor [unclassified Caulobacter]AZS19887.1 TonB-dependent receptor [Caulobacter sp. FWC26]